MKLVLCIDRCLGYVPSSDISIFKKSREKGERNKLQNNGASSSISKARMYIPFPWSSCLCLAKNFHRITEMGELEGTLKVFLLLSFPAPFHYPRLLQAPSNLALHSSRDEESTSARKSEESS